MGKITAPTYLEFTLAEGGKRWAIDDALIYAIWDQGRGIVGIELAGPIIIDVVCDYDILMDAFNHVDLTTPQMELDIEFEPDLGDNVVTL